MRTLLVNSWWSLVLRGLLAFLVGVVTLVWPGITLFALVILFGAYAFVDGVAKHRRRMARGRAARALDPTPAGGIYWNCRRNYNGDLAGDHCAFTCFRGCGVGLSDGGFGDHSSGAASQLHQRRVAFGAQRNRIRHFRRLTYDIPARRRGCDRIVGRRVYVRVRNHISRARIPAARTCKGIRIWRYAGTRA